MTGADGQRQPKRVAVVGGGVSGLAAAHRLLELDPRLSVTLFEAGDQLGGALRTERSEGYLLERGADNFITNVHWGVDLCRRLGIEGELLATNDAFRRAFVVRRGKLLPVPEGFMLMAPSRLWPIVATPLLGPLGKLRLVWEYFVPRRREDGEESLAAFARRRLGRQAYERLVEPLVAGIYTADAERLSVHAALPRFPEMEREHGSLFRAALRQRKRSSGESGARYSLFVAPREGMGQLVATLAGRLPSGSIRLNRPVTELNRTPEDQWRLETPGEPFVADAVILAAGAAHASRLLASADEELARLLGRIPHASSAAVSLGFRREQIRHRLDGFGFVVPAIENRRILAGSFSSVKFPGRAPAGRELIRVFVGGAKRPELVDLDDRRLRDLATEELADLLGVQGEPEICHITRWREAMPQYQLGHRDLVRQIEARVAALTGLELAGAAFHGVGVPHCIHSGEQAAERCTAVAAT